ncbi:glucose-6-phosphate dehydrogenase [Microbacterium sp. Marseille-Q6965]|uniref:glucose-6-phosphate dehydrogenase n=1 Tax=Microbacterium sp. Marseille-Q6965 TaxID=2965072 RepID=UPI0021B79202|nr:glucose-6-phosphate dehydrogenase [Microbacterium sp. Marseille-Q6965]
MGRPSASVVILGAGGDLTERLLLPGLASLLMRHDYDVQVIGASTGESTDDEWRRLVSESFARVEDGGDAPPDLLDSAVYIRADATSAEDLRRVLAACRHTPVIYFALPPSVTIAACEALREVDLPDDTRLALEKPFGTDQASARRLNRLLTRLVPETQIYRIDHFLGMSMVLNILGMRFANRMFEGAWQRESVEGVEIVFDETLGLEGRGGYYDATGALIDMLQSHLLEVMALLAMEPIPRLDEVELRSNIAQVLRSTRVRGGDAVASSRRARYSAGRVGSRELPSYVDEQGVDASRQTETLAEIVCEIDTPRWRGVPFVLRSGKALAEDRTTVTVRMRPVEPIEGLTGTPKPDRITMDLMTGDVALAVTMNGSGDVFALEQSVLTTEQKPGHLLPYGQVLKGILDGDPLLSVRGDVAEESWRIVEPVIAAWRDGSVPLEEYAAGSAGPGWETDRR